MAAQAEPLPLRHLQAHAPTYGPPSRQHIVARRTCSMCLFAFRLAAHADLGRNSARAVARRVLGALMRSHQQLTTITSCFPSYSAFGALPQPICPVSPASTSPAALA